MFSRSISPKLFRSNTNLILRTMTTIPATMKSIIIKENGDVDKLIYEEVPTPKVSEGSVLVKNHVAGKYTHQHFYTTISFYIKASTLLIHTKEEGYTKYLCLTRLEQKGKKEREREKCVEQDHSPFI